MTKNVANLINLVKPPTQTSLLRWWVMRFDYRFISRMEPLSRGILRVHALNPHPTLLLASFIHRQKGVLLTGLQPRRDSYTPVFLDCVDFHTFFAPSFSPPSSMGMCLTITRSMIETYILNLLQCTLLNPSCHLQLSLHRAIGPAEALIKKFQCPRPPTQITQSPKSLGACVHSR